MSWVNGKSSLLSLVMNSEGVETRMVVERRLQVCGRVFPPKFFFLVIYRIGTNATNSKQHFAFFFLCLWKVKWVFTINVIKSEQGQIFATCKPYL